GRLVRLQPVFAGAVAGGAGDALGEAELVAAQLGRGAERVAIQAPVALGGGGDLHRGGDLLAAVVRQVGEGGVVLVLAGPLGELVPRPGLRGGGGRGGTGALSAAAAAGA